MLRVELRRVRSYELAANLSSICDKTGQPVYRYCFSRIYIVARIKAANERKLKEHYLLLRP